MMHGNTHRPLADVRAAARGRLGRGLAIMALAAALLGVSGGLVAAGGTGTVDPNGNAHVAARLASPNESSSPNPDNSAGEAGGPVATGGGGTIDPSGNAHAAGRAVSPGGSSSLNRGHSADEAGGPAADGSGGTVDPNGN